MINSSDGVTIDWDENHVRFDPSSSRHHNTTSSMTTSDTHTTVSDAHTSKRYLSLYLDELAQFDSDFTIVRASSSLWSIADSSHLPQYCTASKLIIWLLFIILHPHSNPSSSSFDHAFLLCHSPMSIHSLPDLSSSFLTIKSSPSRHLLLLQSSTLW